MIRTALLIAYCIVICHFFYRTAQLAAIYASIAIAKKSGSNLRLAEPSGRLETRSTGVIANREIFWEIAISCGSDPRMLASVESD